MAKNDFLTFFGNISRLPDSSVEKRLAERQLAVKSLDSHSWFVGVKKLCIRYGLPDCSGILEKPQSKNSWKTSVESAINRYWCDRLLTVAPLYPSLKWLAYDKTKIATRHPLIETTVTGNLREVPRIAVHFKIATGTYILQTNRASFQAYHNCFVKKPKIFENVKRKRVTANFQKSRTPRASTIISKNTQI